MRAKGKRTLPTERNWDLKTLNSSQAQNFSLGSRDGILSPGHLIRRSVPSPSSSSEGLRGGSAISLAPNTAVNSLCGRPWLWYQILRITHSGGGTKDPQKGDGMTADKVVNFGRHYKATNIDSWEVSVFIQSGWTLTGEGLLASYANVTSLVLQVGAAAKGQKVPGRTAANVALASFSTIKQSQIGSFRSCSWIISAHVRTLFSQTRHLIVAWVLWVSRWSTNQPTGRPLCL